MKRALLVLCVLLAVWAAHLRPASAAPVASDEPEMFDREAFGDFHELDRRSSPTPYDQIEILVGCPWMPSGLAPI